MDNHFLAVASPILLSDAYGINLDKIESDLPDSALGQLLGITEENMEEAMDSFRDFAATQGSSLELSEKSKDTIEEALDTFKSKIKISENGTTSVAINGRNKDCEEYTLKIPKEDLKNLIHTYVETIANDEHFNAFLLGFSASSSGISTEEDLDAALQESLDSFFTSLDETFSDIDEITLLGYVSDGYLLRSDLTVDTTYAPIFWSVELGSERKLTDALTFTMTADDETFVMSHKGHIVPNDGVVESALSVSMAYGEDSQPTPLMEGSFRWDTGAEDQNLTIHFEDPFEEEEFDLSGKLTLKDALTLDLSIPMDSDYEDESLLLTILYNGFPTTEVKKIDGEPVDLLSMDESELQALMLEIQQSINSLQALFQ